MISTRLSQTAVARRDRWDRLVVYLRKSVKACEICHKRKPLEGHVVRKLSQPDSLEARAGNTLIICSECHDHKTYGTGIELTYEEAMGIITTRNRGNDIDPKIG